MRLRTRGLADRLYCHDVCRLGILPKLCHLLGRSGFPLKALATQACNLQRTGHFRRELRWPMHCPYAANYDAGTADRTVNVSTAGFNRRRSDPRSSCNYEVKETHQFQAAHEEPPSLCPFLPPFVEPHKRVRRSQQTRNLLLCRDPEDLLRVFMYNLSGLNF